MSVVPNSPTVLDTTVPSNFAYIDCMDVLERLPRICTVPKVRRELRAGVEAHPYLQNALDRIDESIPVVELNEQVTEAVTERERRLDPGEAQAFAVAEVHGGTLVTDDGPARALARRDDLRVTGSIGVLITAVEDERIDENTADGWLKRWIDETDYRAPSRELSDYR